MNNSLIASVSARSKITIFILSTLRNKFKNETFLNLHFLKDNYTLKEQFEFVSIYISCSNYAECLLLEIPIKLGEMVSSELISSSKFLVKYGRCPIRGRRDVIIEF